jgi:small subunit ribosomal protein S4
MTKRNNRKYALSRRIGKSVWGDAKDPVHTKNYPAGQHGANSRKKTTGYGEQLLAKQLLKGYYGNITERQFRKIYKEADRRKGDTGQNLVGLLESRLDAIVYRAKFVPSVFAARQFVSHKHVTVNGRIVNIPSYVVKPGDVVAIREASRGKAFVMEAVQSNVRSLPDYIQLDQDGYSANYIRMPELAEVPYAVEMKPSLVVEFYSRV